MSGSLEVHHRESSPPDSRGSATTSRLVLKLPRTPRKPSPNFFIAPPHLPSARKRQYKPAHESSLYSTRVDETIGEAWRGKNHFYFARHDGGIAYRFPASFFKENYSDLLEEYEEAKRNGDLLPFDPSAQYVHPTSRMRNEPESEAGSEIESLKIRLPKRTHKTVLSEDDDVVPDSEGEAEDSEEESNEDDEEYGGSRPTSTRQLRPKSKKQLPFSPRKTRSQKVIAIGSESELSAESSIEDEDVAPPRRSTRTKKAMKINLVSDDEDYVEESRNDSRAKKAKGQGKSKRKNKSAPPMYGHIRSIDSLDDDPFSDDEENEALRLHRGICEKCHRPPAHQLLQSFKKSKGKGKKRKRSTDDEFEESEGEQTYLDMGGWVRCLRCPVSAHWKCLASTQRDEVLRAIREKDHEEWETQMVDSELQSLPPKKRSQLEINQTTEFLCGACTRGGICMGCKEVALSPDASRADQEGTVQTKSGDDIEMKDGTKPPHGEPMRTLARELLFRCFTCKRLAHYAHLPVPPMLSDDASVAEVAWHYQDSKSWLCADCSSYKYGVDKIIAWRPYPPNAVETQEPNYKALLPREYLVKWIGKSYRRLDWVPHMWLASTHPSKLKNFITGGTKVELLEKPDSAEDDAMEVDGQPGPLFGDDSESLASSKKPNEITVISPISPMPDAEKRIPKAWKRVDRVLDVLLLRPKERKAKNTKTKKIHKRAINVSEDESESDDRMERISTLVFDKGEQPPDDFTETVDEWETRQTLEKSDIDQVIWAFMKWDELGYDEATWDAPPRPNEPGYAFFQRAFERFIDSRGVLIPKQPPKYWDAFDDRKKDDYRKVMLKSASDLDLGQDPKFKLMPFQVDGFNWLCNNWWNHQHCILADEMGLGKTVQIVSFLGRIASDWQASPALVVVPNSTITNWVREFERWAPRLRVVPFYGEKAARDVIKKFELFHETTTSGYTKAKFHVLVTTYEALTNGKDFTTVFKNQPRWEVLVVDEGQRLKSDSSLLFKKLNELNSIHRIILTGTPLNNNMRELFNLMNFLDPVEWKDLEALEKQHEVLDEELVKQLHNRLRPYFLRRVKSEVLDLPPKNEVIVPISMAPLQREVYRSILSHNLNILNGLTQPGAANASKSRINNVLMQLRKCLQHPYLYAEDIEPRNLPQRETHEKLIDASGKLRFLKTLLPKLKEHGHRVLLFSQFVIALNIVEDFLQGEGYKFLRLDGNTKGNVRQKAMDEFNKPDSEYFIFLLTTRAGGVGINLFTADTVIIFDPDFNPHQDLQAIARAYRYGQKKTCLVFKLMMKDSAEERIMQIGKKKLVLDHLIVQKMDDDEDNGGENIQSILTYGAQALFESNQEARDIVYTEIDIEKLLEKTEKEAVKEAPKAAGGLSFSFAKVWSADKDSMEEVVEDDQTDSWAMTLAKINAEREKEQEREIALSGRGARRKAADIAKTKMNVVGEAFNTPKQKKSTAGSDGSAYLDSDGEAPESSDAEDDDILLDEDFKMNLDTSRHKAKGKATHDPNLIDCGLCGQRHGLGECQMIGRSENLAEYREMLILHADDEPWEERNAAVQAIDEILYKRGHLSLIAGQPLHPLPKGASAVPPTAIPLPARQPQVNASASTSSRQQSGQSQAGPSNHASSSQLSSQIHDSQKKKSKAVPQNSCIVCNQGSHLMKDCSVVRAGSKSISAQIKVLEAKDDPSLKSAIDILRNLLAKAKARELLAASGSGS